MALSRAQTDVVVEQLRNDARALIDTLQPQVEAANRSYLQWALGQVGQDNVPQLTQNLSAAKSIQAAVERLARQASNGLDAAASDRWANAAKDAAKALEAIDGFAGTATLNWVVQQTARATGTEIKDDVNAVASAAAGFAWSAIPWWVLVGGAAVAAWRLGLFRRAA